MRRAPRARAADDRIGGDDARADGRPLTADLPVATVLVRPGLATLLGALIGPERARPRRAAGLRTHARVALAAVLIMLVSAYRFADRAPGPRDPTRMAAPVVSGSDFLGAGAISFRKDAGRGRTTAASLWAAAGLGLAAGGDSWPSRRWARPSAC